MTNRDALKQGVIPCESNPENGELSYTFNTFHAAATLTIKIIDGIDSKLDVHEKYVHLCFDCAVTHFKKCHDWQSRIVWAD